MGCALIGCGKALPALEVQNDELKALVDTNNEWIVTRTGIESRHIALEETNLDLAERAAREALGWDEGGWAARRVEPEEIDLVIFCTITADHLVPSAASELRMRLGLPNAIAFDLNAACTGFVYGVTVAESLMAASAAGVPGAAGRNKVRRALIVGSERLSRITDWAERSTCVLFGDGAGAGVLEWNERRAGVLGTHLVNEDDPTGALLCPLEFDMPVPFVASGVDAEADAEAALRERAGSPKQAITMNGQAVFKFAARAMSDAVTAVLDNAGLTLDDVACIVPHQANERIVRFAAKKLDCSMEKFHLCIAHAGNTSAASVPMGLADAYEAGRIKPGDKVVLVGFGGGFTSGALVYEA